MPPWFSPQRHCSLHPFTSRSNNIVRWRYITVFCQRFHICACLSSVHDKYFGKFVLPSVDVCSAAGGGARTIVIALRFHTPLWDASSLTIWTKWKAFFCKHQKECFFFLVVDQGNEPCKVLNEIIHISSSLMYELIIHRLFCLCVCLCVRVSRAPRCAFWPE